MIWQNELLNAWIFLSINSGPTCHRDGNATDTSVLNLNLPAVGTSYCRLPQRKVPYRPIFSFKRSALRVQQVMRRSHQLLQTDKCSECLGASYDSDKLVNAVGAARVLAPSSTTVTLPPEGQQGW